MVQRHMGLTSISKSQLSRKLGLIKQDLQRGAQ